jgi:LacI family transcriptional regulator, galactose operon repressor
VITSIDIAREAGVSQTTVSRVLNGDPRVAKSTRKRVVDAIERRGYTPNAIARGLVTSRTNLVGVVISDIMNPFYPELLEAIVAQLSEHGLKTVFSNASGQPEDVYTRLLVEQRVDGMIVTSALLDSATVRRLAEQRFPIVLANRYVDGVECDTVSGDNRGGARAAAEHLLELGHERIAILVGHPQSSTSRDRFSGFREAVEEAGIELDPALVRPGGYRYDAAYAETLRLFELAAPPTAVFCLNDLMAFAALNAARSARVAVPEDLSVIGFDDIRMSSWQAFELTTVRQPLAEMARTSVDLLAQRVEAPGSSFRQIVFPSRLVPRRTTGRSRARGRA